MALETWLTKVKTAISADAVRAAAARAAAVVPTRKKKAKSVGVLAFEVAGLMSKLLHLSHSLSDHQAHQTLLSLDGVRKLVSNDDAFLLALACAEAVDALRAAALSASRFCRRSSDPALRRFLPAFLDFADSGGGPHAWAAKDLAEEPKLNRKMDRYVSSTAALYREMEDLASAEAALRKSSSLSPSPPQQSPAAAAATAKDLQRIADLQQKISLQKQKIRYLKERSLWGKSFDSVAPLLARSIFTILARIKAVFGVGHAIPSPPGLNRSLSASAAVYPSENPTTACDFTSGPLAMTTTTTTKNLLEENADSNPSCKRKGFLESNARLLRPAAGTLGAAALALHYANLILVMEKMIRSPQLVGPDARDDLYGMLPASVRAALRERLKGVGFCGRGDPKLAGEWREALGRILGWLAPLAHSMIKWQSERSFEQKGLGGPRANVLLLQTLFFASKEKAEAAITELLVGLNYIWRFEREMTAKALFECSNFNNGGGTCNLQSSASGGGR